MNPKKELRWSLWVYLSKPNQTDRIDMQTIASKMRWRTTLNNRQQRGRLKNPNLSLREGLADAN